MSITGRCVLSRAYSACGAAITSTSALASTSSSSRNRSSLMYGSVHSTALAFSVRIFRSLYARLSRGSSLPALNAMPSTPTVVSARSKRSSSREARPRHVGRSRVVVPDRVADAFEVQPEVVGHHPELVGRGELDVAPRVGEQLGELGLFTFQRHD